MREVGGRIRVRQVRTFAIGSTSVLSRAAGRLKRVVAKELLAEVVLDFLHQHRVDLRSVHGARECNTRVDRDGRAQYR